MRIALADHGLRFAQILVVAVERFLELVEFALGEPAQVLLDDGQGHAPRDHGDARHAADLQGQAFGRIARAHADRVEALQQRQGGAQFVGIDFQFGRHALEDLVERLGQVAIVVEGVDDQFDQGAVARLEHGQAHLLHQVFAQGGGRRFQLRARVLIVGRLGASQVAPLAVALGRARPFGRLAAFEGVAFGRRRRFLRARFGRRFGRRSRCC